MRFGEKSALAAITFSILSVFSIQSPAQAVTCDTNKTIDIAEMTWPSAAALAHIHATILEKGYGCKVAIVAGDTVPTSASMLSRGTPAVAPELWTSAIEQQWAKGEAEGKVVKLADAITDGTVEGWFIPRYMVEKHPELTNAKAVIARPDLFPDPEDASKGRLYSCPPGWVCELSTSALYKALGMDAKWNLFSPGSGGALDASIARAFTRKAPILFYYWGPTGILGKYDTVQIDLGPTKPDVYACNTDKACKNPPGVTDYPSSPAIVGAAAWIKKDAPVVAGYLSKVGLSNAQISELLVYGDENKADAATTAKNFLKTKDVVWSKWVSADVAKKVRGAVN